MNTTISRIAAAAPLAVALLGFGIGVAEAAPMEVADHNQVQPKPDWNDVLIDDLDSGDPEDEPDVPPADPPADEPVDEPAEDDSEEAEEESDEESDDTAEDSNGSNNGGSSSAGGHEASDEADEAGGTSHLRETVEAAEIQVTPVSAAGVQVPAELVASAGVALAAVFGWAAHRRTKAFATA